MQEDDRSLLKQNILLQQEIERLRQDGIRAEQDILDRIGADLHDGPIQLLTLLVMELSQSQGAVIPLEHSIDPDRGARALALATTALQELRDYAAGLVLPEIEELTVSETIQQGVSRHQEATGSHVHLVLGNLPDQLPYQVKICIYRIVQESLNNAFRHAGGLGQSVTAAANEGHIKVAVRSAVRSGPPIEQENIGRGGLGIAGMKRRLGQLGGNLKISTHDGMEVEATLPLAY